LAQSNISIYPNPAEDQFQIDGINNGMSIKIFNTFGQEVMSVKNISSNENIDCTPLESGMYFCQISNGTDQMETIRFLKK
jgi:hypothetical protein